MSSDTLARRIVRLCQKWALTPAQAAAVAALAYGGAE
jgi:hypothetical protein